MRTRLGLIWRFNGGNNCFWGLNLFFSFESWTRTQFNLGWERSDEDLLLGVFVVEDFTVCPQVYSEASIEKNFLMLYCNLQSHCTKKKINEKRWIDMLLSLNMDNLIHRRICNNYLIAPNFFFEKNWNWNSFICSH